MTSPLRAVVPTAEPLTQEEIVARIQAYVERGEYPLIAAERVARDLCAEGRQDELLVLFYPPPLFDLWESAKPATAHRTRPKSPNVPTLRQKLRDKGALLESMVDAGGVWKRLGDMTRADCMRAAGLQKRKALSIAQRARFYHAVATRLSDEQAVRDVLGDDDLARIFQESAP